MTSEAVVSLFTASLAATERALAEESAKARHAESALAAALTRVHKLEMELLLARAESAQWRNRFALEAERRAWERERRELQRGPAAQQPGADNSPSTSSAPGPPQTAKESEEAQEAPQEPSPPATPLKPNDPPAPALQEPRPLAVAFPIVELVPTPPVSATPSSHDNMSRPDEPCPVSTPPSAQRDVSSTVEPRPVSSPPPPSSLPHLTRTPALPRVEQISAMSVKVYIEQERYPTAINLIGRLFGPSSMTLKSIEAATGCVLKVYCDRTVSQFRGAPYVLVRRDGRACFAGLAKVHDAVTRVQQILTPPPHGRDELWAQQLRRLRELDAKRAAERALQQLQQQVKAFGSRSMPAVVQPIAVCETTSELEAPAFGSEKIPLEQLHQLQNWLPKHQSQQLQQPKAVGSRSTPTIAQPSEALKNTCEEAPPAFGTRSEKIPLEQLHQLQNWLPRHQQQQKRSKPRQQQQQFGQKEALIGVWRL